MINAMSRLIAQLLIISLLTLNAAWAADECAFTALDDAGSLSSQIDDKSPPNNSGTKFDCDDWCHAWVTVVALPGAIILASYTPATINGGFNILPYSSLTASPPFHPPIT